MYTNKKIDKFKFVYAYSDFVSQSYETSNKSEALKYISRLNDAGYDVKPFNLTLNAPGPALTWKELDLKWKAKDRKLISHYENLLEALSGNRILINASGINLHPEFVEQIVNLKFFQCFDDPENSDNLSRPVASAYDICLVGNAAEVSSYKEWGAKRAVWQPLGIQPGLADPGLTAKDVGLESLDSRDIPAILIADFLYSKRASRLKDLIKHFPQGSFYGPGAPSGYLPQSEFLSVMRRSQIGFNVHNSTGPINARTFYLPANGVMQICDNKSFLSEAFVPGVEIIGADSIDEMIELGHYFLQNPDQQREIALAGWRRAMNDYTEEATFHKIYKLAENLSLDSSQTGIQLSAITIRDRQDHSFATFMMAKTIKFRLDSIYALFKLAKTFKGWITN